ncbi:MAG TPA: ADP-ribosyl-(dinitrogen reductase) hydrolase [Noviherbaspirillum sp.]|nr:ADP-ribosyl-(dinitrogen reductase) hydrolase [Noviherbaspirillum sp.]
MKIRISQKIQEKIDSRNISQLELWQCFHNIEGDYLEDTRAEHLTDPITQWFVAETDKGRLLKIMFVSRDDGVELKSAYEASDEICRIYRKYGM